MGMGNSVAKKMFIDDAVPYGSKGQRPMSGPLKVPAETATKCGCWKLPSGQLTAQIHHGVLEGVTTEMMEWFFNNMDAVVKLNGVEVPAYWLWHHEDHILALAARDKEGKMVGLHIREAFGRNPAFMVEDCACLPADSNFRKGIRLEIRTPLGCLGFLQHQWTDVEGGVKYQSLMLVGQTAQGASPADFSNSEVSAYPNEGGNFASRAFVNNVMIPKKVNPPWMAAWLTHNVEEVGLLQQWLPTIYNDRANLVVPGKSVFDIWEPAKTIPLSYVDPIPALIADAPKQWWDGGEPLDPMRELPKGGDWKVYPDPDMTGATVILDLINNPAPREEEKVGWLC